MRLHEVQAVYCPTCGVEPGVPCPGLPDAKVHPDRFRSARGDSCDKTVYRRKNIAVMIARRQSAHTGTEIVAYKCTRCHGFHTGHPSPPKVRGTV